MKHGTKLLAVLLCGCLLTGTSCGKNNSSSDSVSVESTPQTEKLVIPEEGIVTVPPSPETTASNQAKADGSYDIYVTIQSVEISLEELKNNNYTVPVYVSLDQNSGITYTEWGAYYDSRCTLEYDVFDREVYFDTVCSVNEEEHFFWTAWASANLNQRDGNLILLNLTLPMDAAAGDSYPVTYASTSLANKPHVWNCVDETKSVNWAVDGSVGWQDGGITVTE